MKQLCFGILSKFCVFILIGLSDLNKIFVHGQNLNTLNASSTTPSINDVTTLSYANNESTIASDLTTTIETSYTDDVISSNITVRFHSEEAKTEPSNDTKSVHSNDLKPTQTDKSFESSVDELQVRFHRSNDSSSPETTINPFLDKDDTKFTTETILLDTAKPSIIQSRINAGKTAAMNNQNSQHKNAPKELSKTLSNYSGTPVVQDNSTRGRRFLVPTATNIHDQTFPSTNNLVDVLSSRLIELYIANVHSTEGLPSPEVLSVLLSPLHVIIEQAINLLGLSNCRLMCDNNPQPIYIHKPGYEHESINIDNSKQSRILEMFSKLVNHHQLNSATKTPWLDILRVISPVDCYKPDKKNMQLEALVNMLLNKYGYLNRPRPPIMPIGVPIALHSTPVKPPVFEHIPNYPLPRPRLPILPLTPKQHTIQLPLWQPIKSEIPIVPQYPKPDWPQFQVRPPFQIPRELPKPYRIPHFGGRQEIQIPNINLVPWPERPKNKQVQPPSLVSLPQLKNPNQLSPLLNIWYIIEKLKAREQTLKPKLPKLIKPNIPITILPMLPKLKPLFPKTIAWPKKPQPKLPLPTLFIPKFKPIKNPIHKWSMPNPFIPVLPPIRLPYIPQKPSKIILPTLPQLNLPKKPLLNPLLQTIFVLKSKPKYPLPSLILPRLPRPVSSQPSYYKPNPTQDKICTVLELLKANKPCLVKKVPITPHYSMPNLTLPLPPVVKPIQNTQIFKETVKPKPLPKIMNLEQLKIPKVPSIIRLPKLILPSIQKPIYPRPINPIPILELPRPPRLSFQLKPSVTIAQPHKPTLIPWLAKFIPTPQIHINIPNINFKPINFKPISKNWNIPPPSQYKEPWFDLFPGMKPLLTKWNQIKMPSPYLPPLNRQVSGVKVSLLPQVPQLMVPNMRVVAKLVPKITPKVQPTIPAPKYYKLPCENRTPAHILFPSLKKPPMSGKISGYHPYPSPSGPLFYQTGVNIGLKPTMPIQLKPEQYIHGHEQGVQVMSHQIQHPLTVFKQPIFTPTHIPMKVQPGTAHPIVLVSKPGVSTTTVDKDGNLIGKIKINANGKPCIELDHPALQIIAQHEQASLHGGKKQGWFELWYNDGTGPEKQRWKLVWNDKEIHDYLQRKNNYKS